MISNVSRREDLLNAPGVSTANRISSWIDVASTTGGWGGRLTSYRAIGVCATPSRAIPGEVSGPRTPALSTARLCRVVNLRRAHPNPCETGPIGRGVGRHTGGHDRATPRVPRSADWGGSRSAWWPHRWTSAPSPTLLQRELRDDVVGPTAPPRHSPASWSISVATAGPRCGHAEGPRGAKHLRRHCPASRNHRARRQSAWRPSASNSAVTSGSRCLPTLA